MPDRDLTKLPREFSPVAGNKEKAVRIYGGQYTNSGSCNHTPVRRLVLGVSKRYRGVEALLTKRPKSLVGTRAGDKQQQFEVSSQDVGPYEPR